MNKETVAVLSDFDQIVKIKGSKLTLYTNGSGELFINTGKQVYRMQESEGLLHVVTKGSAVKQYGGTTGLTLIA